MTLPFVTHRQMEEALAVLREEITMLKKSVCHHDAYVTHMAEYLDVPTPDFQPRRRNRAA
jgi:hypothetical protein